MTTKTHGFNYNPSTGHFTVGQAAAFSMCPFATILHLFRAGELPGSSVSEEGEIVIPIAGLKEARSKDHVTCTRDNRTFYIRHFHGTDEATDKREVVKHETNDAADQFAEMWTLKLAKNGNGHLVCKEDDLA